MKYPYGLLNYEIVINQNDYHTHWSSDCSFNHYKIRIYNLNFTTRIKFDLKAT